MHRSSRLLYSYRGGALRRRERNIRKVRSLHSILLTNDPSPNLPWRIEQNLSSFGNAYPGMTHTLYDRDSGRAFIAQHFDRDVVAAWDDLVPFAYKSDLLRYCLLYQLGGIYSDISIHHFFPIALPETRDLVIFRDGFNAAPWIVSTSLVCSRAQNRVFLHAIEEIVRNVKARFYGVNPLCPTGPNLFGQALAKHAELWSLATGEAVQVKGTRSLVYVDPTGEVVATNVKRGGGLASLGGSHQDYNQLYAMRRIYADEHGLMSWSATELKRKGFTKEHGGNADQPQIVVFGPYATLALGTYRATYQVRSAASEALHPGRLEMDVCARCGEQPIAHSPPQVMPESSGSVAISVTFVIEALTTDLEVRLFSAQPLPLCEQALVIESCAAT